MKIKELIDALCRAEHDCGNQEIKINGETGLEDIVQVLFIEKQGKKYITLETQE